MQALGYIKAKLLSGCLSNYPAILKYSKPTFIVMQASKEQINVIRLPKIVAKDCALIF